MSEKFYLEEQYKERFYQLPKVFFTNPNYKKLSNDAKIAYAILRDRLDLSILNRWVDEENAIYFIYTNDNLMDILNLGKNKIIKIKKELENVKLLEQKRQGLNKPNMLYLKKPHVNIDDIYKIQESENVDKVNSGKEVCKTNFQKFTKQTSRGCSNKLQEVAQTNSNDTEFNDTDLNKTEYNDHHHKDAQSINYSDTDKQSKNTESKNSDDDGDNSLKSVLNVYKESFDKAPSKNISEKLRKDIEQNGKELVLYAINEAMEKDKTNYSYVKGILKRLQERNITSRQQAESYQHHKQSQQQIQSKEITPEWLHNKGSNQEKEITPEEQKQLEKDREAFLENLDKTWG